jgi:hypothetical protein
MYTNQMDPLDILHKFLISDTYPWMRSVFLHQGGWSVAVNRMCLLAYKGEIGASLPETPTLPILQTKPKKVTKVSLYLLRSWISEVEPQMVEVDDVPVFSQGILAGIKLDLRKLAFITSLFPSEEFILVWSATKLTGVKSLGFECGPWRGCLAGVDGPSSECSNVFKEVPEDSAFDLMMELESE